ncbi:alpha/beta hydrolase [Streptosporangiaceae bacterium NEAU-GS5]|nr:alpha/beta hydrolase [Streptosporangiaceae bacterium NEAU-GS5]
MNVWFEEAGAGEPLVLLHSGAADSRMWDPLWPALTKRFRVVRLDFRGFGRSPYEADGPCSDTQDVAAVMKGLGIGPATIVGSSYGGGVALRLATLYPDLVSRMVLFCPMAWLPRTADMQAFAAEENRLFEAGDIDGAVELNVRTWVGPSASEEARREVAEMQRRAFELQSDGELETIDEAIDLPSITVPVVVVAGGQDMEYFQETARHLARTLPDARLVELPWAGHLPTVERPEETLDLIY